MNKDSRIAMIEVNKNKKGKLFIKTNLEERHIRGG